jgi:hypothetical protein
MVASGSIAEDVNEDLTLQVFPLRAFDRITSREGLDDQEVNYWAKIATNSA